MQEGSRKGLLELPSDRPTAVNSDPSHLASLRHLFIRGFFAEYEVEEAHKEALAITESVGPGSSTTTGQL